MNINNHLTSLVQTQFQAGDAGLHPSFQMDAAAAVECGDSLSLSPFPPPLHLGFKAVNLMVSFRGIPLTSVFFFLSFVPALKRLSLGLLFLVTYTLSSLYISDEYLTSDDYMVCIPLALWGVEEFHFSGGL